MAIRQYVGARYVPKFSDVNGGVWDDSYTYEPLTIVRHGNDYYTSKKEVPTGIAITNTEYWVLTGNYNGAISELQDEIDAISEEISGFTDDITAINGSILTMGGQISTLESTANNNIWHGKKVVVYGDSLSSIDTNYWQYMVELDPSIEITNRAVGGTRIQDAETRLNAATDLASFDIIVLAYGTNSWANTALRPMVQSYQQCFNIIGTKAPMAQIVCIAPFYSYRTDYTNGTENTLRLSLIDYCNAIMHIASINGAIGINLYDIAGVNVNNYTSLLQNSDGIYVHQTEALGRRIARLLIEGVVTPDPAYGYSYVETGTTSGLIIIKTPIFTLLATRGAVPIAALTELSIEHISPGYNPSGIARTNQGNFVSVTWFTAGNFAVTGASTGDTSITSLNIIGVNGNYR